MKICYFMFKNGVNLMNLFEIENKKYTKNYSRQYIWLSYLLPLSNAVRHW
jgi:hypothetical protein